MESSAWIGVFLFASLLSGIDCLVWKSCDESGRSKVSAVTIVGCESDPVCVLKKGQNASFAVTFVINEDATSAKAVVHGIVAGVPVPFPIPNPDGCKDSGLTCPLKKGTQYTYSTKIPVKPEYPSIKLVVKFELQDQDSNDIFCVQIPVAIGNGNKYNVKKLHFLQNL